jgi:elongation factor Ts
MEAAVANNVKSIDELNAVKIGNETVADKLNEQVAKIGEKIICIKI